MKFNKEVSSDCIKADVKRLTNQMWKLIPMREHEEDWVKQLDTVELEIVGLEKIFSNPLLLQLICKLEGLREKKEEIEFSFYRKTIFECISILQEFGNE